MLAELLLLCALLIAAALPLIAWLWRRSGRGARAALSVAAAGALAAALALASVYQRTELREAAVPSGRPIAVRGDGFTSSDACRACHPDQYASWRDSYHRTMTQQASPESVLAPFDGRVVEMGHRYRLERRGDAFVAVSDDPSWLTADVPEPKNERRIVLVSGFHHHQVYWYESGHGRQLGRLPFFYRVEERRFAPFHAVFLAQEVPTEFSGEAIWNSSCLRCHTTDPRPRFGDFTKMDTEVAEFGIACESCHGPGQEHVEKNRNPLRRYASHFGEGGDPTIVNPRRLSAARASQACGLCHSVHVFRDQQAAYDYSENGPSFRPGDDIEKFWTIVRAGGPETPVVRANLERDPHWVDDRFWPDGMVNVVGREYNAVEASPCFAGGEFSCLSCHDLHQHSGDARPRKQWANDQLGPGMDGDAACLQCHEALREGVEAHTHHPVESAGSRCQDCHMPHTTWGLLKAARSHQIDSPNAATTLSTGRMNACNLCHMDRTLAWTAQQLEAWYGIASPEIAGDHREVAEGVLHALRGDAGQRAIAAWNMGRAEVRAASGSDWMLPVLAELLLDPYEGVRHAAFGSVRALPGYEGDDFDYLAPEASRRATRDALLARWQNETRAPVAGDARRVLRAQDGALDRARLSALLSQRDDRRVFRGE